MEYLDLKLMLNFSHFLMSACSLHLQELFNNYFSYYYLHYQFLVNLTNRMSFQVNLAALEADFIINLNSVPVGIGLVIPCLHKDYHWVGLNLERSEQIYLYLTGREILFNRYDVVTCFYCVKV